MTNQIQVKLFAGFLLKLPMKEALYKNPQWKNSQIDPATDSLIEIKEGKKSYVGIYLKEDAVTFKSLQQTEKKLKLMLQNILKDLPSDELHLEIFSKLFVS